MAIAQSGISHIDLLLDDHSWTGTVGSPAYLTYKLGTLSWTYQMETDPNVSLTNVALLSSNEKDAFKAALASWTNVASIELTELETNNPLVPSIVARKADDVLYYGNNQAGLSGPTYTPGTDGIEAYDVVFDKDYISTSPGTDGFRTLLHETGHVLFDFADPNIGTTDPYPNLDRQLTVMSYNNDGDIGSYRQPVTPMVYDIAAAQYLYGANITHHAGDTEYGYSASATFNGLDLTGDSLAWTIWDAGGNDTMDASDASFSVVLDLRGGVDTMGTSDVTDDVPYFSEIADERIAIAFGVDIENAVGGSGDDTIIGGEVGNSLDGGGGNDEITGNGGADSLKGGAGNDTLGGNQGSDSLEGGNGYDVYLFQDGDGFDRILDTDGSGHIVYGSDALTGTAEETGPDTGIYRLTTAGGIYDMVWEDAGLYINRHEGAGTIWVEDFDNGDLGLTLEDDDNSLTVGTPPVQFDGPVEDFLPEYRYYLTYHDGLIGNQPPDTGNHYLYGMVIGVTQGNLGVDTIENPGFVYSGSGDMEAIDASTMEDNHAVTIYGGEGMDGIVGSWEDDKLYGGEGHDIINGIRGNDTVFGGSGNDSIYNGEFTEDPGMDMLYGGAGDDAITGGSNIDNLYGDSGSDILEGDDGNDFLFGGSGNDQLIGGAGDDFLDGGSGVDILDGGDGSDSYAYSSIDYIDETGSTGIDFVISFDTSLSVGNFTGIEGLESPDPVGDGNNNILIAVSGSAYGYGGNDTLSASESASTGITLLGDSGNDSIRGSAFSDSLNGGTDADTLIGAKGNDTIIGESGNDTISGELGNDSLLGGDGHDTFSGGAGNDTIRGANGNDIIIYNYGDGGDEIYDIVGDDRIDLNNITDLHDITGYTVLNVNGVTSTALNFADGGYVYLYGVAQVNLTTYADPMLTGNYNALRLNQDDDSTVRYDGRAGQWLVAESDDSRLIGGTNNQFIAGNAGDDVMTGGAGADTFYYGAENGLIGHDIITDFAVGTDKIDIRYYGTNWTALQPAISTNGDGDAVLTFYSGNDVTLEGVSAASLSASDFIFT